MPELSLTSVRHIEEVCNRFETALKAKQSLPIEDYLGDAAEPMRSELLRELVRLEIDYRVKRGEQPTVEEYRSRFPTHADSIASWFPSEPTVGFDFERASAATWPTVPGYEINAELGRGAMGVVYQARHMKFERTVALKMILGSFADTEHTQRFLAEARAVARLVHPNIVQIYDTGEHNGLPYFSMEYVEGGTLATRLKDTPPSDLEAARLIEALARAVQYMHGRGIVHRDLKPANILLTKETKETKERVPKIADFGLAKFQSEGFSGTISGTILGTPSYMAPEQAAGRSKEIGPAADVYSLGAILYELITGRPPFRGSTWMETVRMVVEQPPDPPHLLNPRVDRALEAICLKCLQKGAADRYATAEALAEDLAALLRGERPGAYQGTVSEWIGVVFKETRYTELMQLWSGIWMGIAVNALVASCGHVFLLWYNVQDWLPYCGVWIVKLLGDWGLAWFLRARSGPPTLPLERTLLQIWVFFWVNFFFLAWFYQRSGGPVAGMIPITDIATALTFGVMAAILGGSFYISAALCVIMALLNALWPGAGALFGAVVISPYFFCLGWKHSRHTSGR